MDRLHLFQPGRSPAHELPRLVYGVRLLRLGWGAAADGGRVELRRGRGRRAARVSLGGRPAGRFARGVRLHGGWSGGLRRLRYPVCRLQARWRRQVGQADLAGSVWDWTLDVDIAYPDACDDC